MATEEIVKSLETLGFTNYESRAFYALVEGRLMTASEVAKQAKIPRSSAYSILKSFAEKGICNEIQTSSVAQYELIDPHIVKDKIEKEIRDTFETKFSKLTDSFGKLQEVFRVKELESKKTDVELIKGFNTLRHVKFLDLVKASQKEILVMNRARLRKLEEQDKASVDFLKKGGTIKCIYEVNHKSEIVTSADESKEVTMKELAEIFENYEKQGEQIRLTDSVPQNMAVFDRKTVFINLVDPNIPKYNRSDIIVKNDNFANFMADTFNICWERAITIAEFKNKFKL